MSRRSLGLVVGGLLFILALPAGAAAGGAGAPAAVGVRVEGASDTLLPRTAVTDRKSVV